MRGCQEKNNIIFCVILLERKKCGIKFYVRWMDQRYVTVHQMNLVFTVTQSQISWSKGMLIVVIFGEHWESVFSTVMCILIMLL